MTEIISNRETGSYRETRERIRQLVSLLNSDELEPEAMVETYEEGCKLVQRAEHILEQTRLRVIEISEKYGPEAGDQ